MSNESKPQEWFYLHNENWNGPFNTPALKELVKKSLVGPDTLLRIGIAGVPIKAHQVKSLFAEKPGLCSEGCLLQVSATWPFIRSLAMAKFATCPRCSSSNVSKVSDTWWGGIVGPYLLNHVRCQDCGTTYNGKTGKSNTVPIIIYQVVTWIVFFAFIAFLRRLNSLAILLE